MSDLMIRALMPTLRPIVKMLLPKVTEMLKAKKLPEGQTHRIVILQNPSAPTQGIVFITIVDCTEISLKEISQVAKLNIDLTDTESFESLLDSLKDIF